MIANHHLDELDSAVRMARNAVHAGLLDEPEPLTRFLYERWYLGLSTHPAEPPGAEPTWQAWGPRWTRGTADRGSDLVRLHLSADPRTVLHVLGLITARAAQWEHPW